jgi:hypothetical protein
LFDAVSEDAQRKSLSGRHRFFFRGPICQYTRHVHYLRNPVPISFNFCFDFIHDMRHACILARSHFCGIKVWLGFPNITRRI